MRECKGLGIGKKCLEIEFLYPEELWDFLVYLESNYPKVKWLCGENPTKWFPRIDEPHNLIHLGYRGNFNTLTINRDYSNLLSLSE